MLHEPEANDEAQWNGRPLVMPFVMYETLKHGTDCTSRVVFWDAGPFYRSVNVVGQVVELLQRWDARAG
jgi:hypothetical protein